MQDLEQIISKFEEIVSPNFCNNLAKRVGFIKRSTSQLQGYEFAQAMMVPNAFIEAETLNSLAVRMRKINKGCNLSAPALAQRMNTEAAEAFMKACFAKVLKEIVQKEFINLPDLRDLGGFNRILIEDSTMAELHEKLSPYFKGRGGAASKAALKINYIFDYLSEQIVDIEFFSGNIPDQSLAGRIIPLLEKDDLVIRDLGYYVLKRVEEIEKAGAYYISRLKSNVDVYESKEATEPLDLAAFLDSQNYQGLIDTEVFIGNEKYPVRLLACQMSEEAINKRRRDANRTAQRSGRQITKKKLNLLKYSIFITNIPVEMLCSINVMAIYRARWRVELIFKQWKSCLNLHIFKGYKKERIHCLLYGRFIMILLLGSISSILMQYAFNLGRELSCFKLINYLIADHFFAIALLEGKIGQFINNLLEDIPRRLCLDKRKRLSMRSNVRIGQSYYNEFINNDLYKKAA
jgi:DDE family transposase